MAISPPDDVLRAAFRDIRSKNPTLGTNKLHALLLSQYEGWVVSEKRAKKILASENLVLSPHPVSSKSNETAGTSKQSNEALHPRSRIIDNLDVTRWSKKVKVVDFGSPKGKGLVATEDIEEGEDIWKEDPFAIAPEWCARSDCLGSVLH